MTDRIKTFLKCSIFLSILISSLYMIDKVLEPKYFINTSSWTATAGMTQFYEKEKNSIDVLFLGSSVAVNNFIPQLLYNEFGIRSYNLASEQQSMILSYYRLLEALRYQKPKVVIVEGLYMEQQNPKRGVNTAEPFVRKCLDPMHLSLNKIKAVKDVCSRDKSLKLLSFYLTNIRFHDRWKGLGENDFNPGGTVTPILYGWAPGKEAIQTVKPFDRKEDEEPIKLREDMVDYFYKISDVCRKNNIKLILTKIPHTIKNIVAIDAAYKKVAETKGASYYCFQEKTIYNRMNIDEKYDNVVHHGNLSGNQKITRLIGEILTQKYGLSKTYDLDFEKAKTSYDDICISYNLNNIDDVDEYLKAINRPSYVVMLAVKDDAAKEMQIATKTALKELGLQARWDNESMYQHGYSAFVSEEQVVEDVAALKKESVIRGSFRKKRNQYSITSSGAGVKSGPKSSILIDGKEVAVNTRGLNVVVYDLYQQKVIDSVAFDTSGDSKATRKQ